MNDSISRQAAIDALGEAPEVWTDSPEEFAALNQWEMDVAAIKAVPSVQPKTGKWKYTKFHSWECSQCKKNPTKGLGYVQSKDELFDFCPNCGADMRGEQDE